jgi:hypothetical protein
VKTADKAIRRQFKLEAEADILRRTNQILQGQLCTLLEEKERGMLQFDG